MKLKYFVRGLGVGIVLTAIVFTIAFHNLDMYKLTDEEITIKAKELGLVEKEDESIDIDKLLEKERETSSKDVEIKPNEQSQTKPEEVSKEEPEESEEISHIEIEIKSGMTSEDVSNLLKENGLIKESEDFNKHMVENGYSTLLRIGKYDIPIDATYTEIEKVLTKK